MGHALVRILVLLGVLVVVTAVPATPAAACFYLGLGPEADDLESYARRVDAVVLGRVTQAWDEGRSAQVNVTRFLKGDEPRPQVWLFGEAPGDCYGSLARFQEDQEVLLFLHRGRHQEPTSFRTPMRENYLTVQGEDLLQDLTPAPVAVGDLDDVLDRIEAAVGEEPVLFTSAPQAQPSEHDASLPSSTMAPLTPSTLVLAALAAVLAVGGSIIVVMRRRSP